MVIGGEGRLVGEQVAVAGAGVGEVGVARGVDDDVATPAPAPLGCWSIDSSSRCSSHMTARSDRPSSASTAPPRRRPTARRPRGSAAGCRLRDLALGPLVVLRVDRDDALRPVAEVEHERRVEGAEAVRYAGSKRPGECAKRTSLTVPGASGHQAWTARSASARSAARSPNRLNASAGDHSRSAHSRWWSKLWCGSMTDVRALTASSAPGVTKFAPVSLRVVERQPAADRPRRLAPASARSAAADRVPVGLAPLRLVVARLRLNAVICGRPGLSRLRPSSAPPRAPPRREPCSRRDRTS